MSLLRSVGPSVHPSIRPAVRPSVRTSVIGWLPGDGAAYAALLLISLECLYVVTGRIVKIRMKVIVIAIELLQSIDGAHEILWRKISAPLDIKQRYPLFIYSLSVYPLSIHLLSIHPFFYLPTGSRTLSISPRWCGPSLSSTRKKGGVGVEEEE